jgi:hypothetical protein
VTDVPPGLLVVFVSTKGELPPGRAVTVVPVVLPVPPCRHPVTVTDPPVVVFEVAACCPAVPICAETTIVPTSEIAEVNTTRVFAITPLH